MLRLAAGLAAFAAAGIDEVQVFLYPQNVASVEVMADVLARLG